MSWLMGASVQFETRIKVSLLHRSRRRCQSSSRPEAGRSTTGLLLNEVPAWGLHQGLEGLWSSVQAGLGVLQSVIACRIAPWCV